MMEWNVKILSLTSEQFEELCYDIIDSLGFTNLIWRRGGRDKSTDILCDRVVVEPDGFTTSVKKWYIQCKRFKLGIPFNKISSSVDWAIDERASHFVVMSNSYLTTDCREQITKRADQNKINFIDWTNKKFQKLLFEKPHILESYFPDERIPENEKKIPPHSIIKLEFNVPKDFKDEFMGIMSLDESERNKEVVKFIKNKVLQSPAVDLNIKSLIYQQFSVIAYYQGDFEGAISDLDKALKITPNNRAVLLNKGFLLTRMKQYGDAIKYYDKVLEIDPKDKFAWNNKAHCLEQKNKNKIAMYCLNKALEVDPNFILAKDNKGSLLNKQHLYEEALDIYDEILETHPNSKTTLNKKAVLLKDMKDLSEAYKLVNLALKIDPTFVQALNTKGVILERNGQYGSEKYGESYKEKYNKLALETFEEVIKLDDKFDLGHTNRVVALNNLQQLEEALKYADEAVKKFPESSIAWEKKGIVLQNLGRYDKSLECIRKARKMNPYLREALLEEGIIYLKTRKFKKAKRVFEDMIKIYGKDDDAWGLKGNAWAGMGREEKANKCYKKAKSLMITIKSLIE